MSTRKVNRTALDDHVEGKAANMGLSERHVRNMLKSQHPELYAELAAQPSAPGHGAALRLQAYVDAQGPASVALRRVEMPDAPWPAVDNAAVQGLIAEATRRHAAGEEVGELITWAVVHGFFEGRIAAATGEPVT